jgi:hypothetical protein
MKHDDEDDRSQDYSFASPPRLFLNKSSPPVFIAGVLNIGPELARISLRVTNDASTSVTESINNNQKREGSSSPRSILLFQCCS